MGFKHAPKSEYYKYADLAQARENLRADAEQKRWQQDQARQREEEASRYERQQTAEETARQTKLSKTEAEYRKRRGMAGAGSTEDEFSILG